MSGPKLVQKFKKLMVEKKFFYEKNYCKIGVNTDNDLPLGKSLKFLILIVNINLVFQSNNKLSTNLLR